MGAWGAGSFENDSALDWVWEIEEATDLGPIEKAISDVLNTNEYLEVDEGCMALAAAEVVAALRNKPTENLPEEVTNWVQRNNVQPSDELVTNALKAIDKIRNNEQSELKELWEESDSIEEWYLVLDDLMKRLT